MSHKILQWNRRGIRANYKELLQLQNKHNPKVVCLQETFLKDKKTVEHKTLSVMQSPMQRLTQSFWGCLYPR